MTRIDTICSLVLKDTIVYDIGCDHGYLLLKLYPKIKKGFALDIAEKPLKSATKTINQNNLQDKITPMLSDGLEKVDFKHCDTIVIAGMGGHLISSIILKYEGAKNKEITFLLQSMSKTEYLRQFLFGNGFEIVKEKIAIENNIVYTIIQCKFTNNIIKKDILDCFVSQDLLKQENFNLYAKEYIEKSIDICNKIQDKTNENFIFHKKLKEKFEEYKNA